MLCMLLCIWHLTWGNQIHQILFMYMILEVHWLHLPFIVFFPPVWLCDMEISSIVISCYEVILEIISVASVLTSNFKFNKIFIMTFDGKKDQHFVGKYISCEVRWDRYVLYIWCLDYSLRVLELTWQRFWKRNRYPQKVMPRLGGGGLLVGLMV